MKESISPLCFQTSILFRENNFSLLWRFEITTKNGIEEGKRERGLKRTNLIFENQFGAESGSRREVSHPSAKKKDELINQR